MYSVEVRNGLYDIERAAEKWGVTPRRVNYYCAGGRIPGAVKMAGVWLLLKLRRSRLMAGQNKERNYAMNKILIIDDDRELCALIKRSVQSEHIEAIFVIPEKRACRN